jgi:hypothetical protein
VHGIESADSAPKHGKSGIDRRLLVQKKSDFLDSASPQRPQSRDATFTKLESGARRAWPRADGTRPGLAGRSRSLHTTTELLPAVSFGARLQEVGNCGKCCASRHKLFEKKVGEKKKRNPRGRFLVAINENARREPDLWTPVKLSLLANSGDLAKCSVSFLLLFFPSLPVRAGPRRWRLRMTSSACLR